MACPPSSVLSSHVPINLPPFIFSTPSPAQGVVEGSNSRSPREVHSEGPINMMASSVISELWKSKNVKLAGDLPLSVESTLTDGDHLEISAVPGELINDSRITRAMAKKLAVMSLAQSTHV